MESTEDRLRLENCCLACHSGVSQAYPNPTITMTFRQAGGAEATIESPRSGELKNLLDGRNTLQEFEGWLGERWRLDISPTNPRLDTHAPTTVDNPKPSCPNVSKVISLLFTPCHARTSSHADAWLRLVTALQYLFRKRSCPRLRYKDAAGP